MDFEQILGRIADVALRDKIRRQIEIQNETISNLESLTASQSRTIAQLEREIADLKKQLKSILLPSPAEVELFESDSVYWSFEEKQGQKFYRAHCPQCQKRLNRIIDFWECKSCGFQNLGGRDKPSSIPEWAC